MTSSLFSGRKIHAPKGGEVLFIRRGAPIRPFFYGGHQEFGRRGGTENIPYIIGLAKTMEPAAATHPGDVARTARRAVRPARPACSILRTS
ncbi:MAG: aminotransferase class V-fold PLP-dependent enzyme [Thermoguttaceae bacterium]